MKQRIEPEDLEQLSDKQKRVLKELYGQNGLPLFSVGQLIEIIRKLRQMDIYTVDDWWYVQLFDLETCANDGRDCESESSSRELCDALWQTVREIL